MHLEDHGPQLEPRDVHGRVLHGGGAYGSGRAGNRVDGSLVRDQSEGLLIRTVRLVLPSAAAIDDVPRAEGARISVVLIDEERSFVGMAVARQHQIHAIALQDGHGVLPHLDQLDLAVRLVRAVAVRRVMPVGDDPVLIGDRQVVLQPVQHDPALVRGRAIRAVRVQNDEMDVGVIERVVGLGSGGQPARLARGRQAEDLKVRLALARRTA